MNPTDEMVDAAMIAYEEDYDFSPENRGYMRRAVTAALDAAPTVEDAVFCVLWGATASGPNHPVQQVGMGEVVPCPGPHRTLIIGDEV